MNRKEEGYKATWLRHINTAMAPHDLRQIFNKTCKLVSDPEVHNAFFERIHFLKSETVDSLTLKSLELLREDIETEMEDIAYKESLPKEAPKDETARLPKLVPPNPLLSLCEDGLVLNLDLINEVGLLKKAERTIIIKTLIENDENRTKTAKALGCSIRCLRNKIIEYKKDLKNNDRAISAMVAIQAGEISESRAVH